MPSLRSCARARASDVARPRRPDAADAAAARDGAPRGANPRQRAGAGPYRHRQGVGGAGPARAALGVTGPFVVVHCGALSAELLESELFGHMKGSFTGAYRDQPGLVEAAHGGTLFLDEVGEMPPPMQVKLLRASCRKGTFVPVGGRTQRQAEVRVVAATHRDLEAMVRDSFREDLYYRLKGVVLRTPALAERMADVPLLAARFLKVSRPRRDSRPARWPGSQPASGRAMSASSRPSSDRPGPCCCPVTRRWTPSAPPRRGGQFGTPPQPRTPRPALCARRGPERTGRRLIGTPCSCQWQPTARLPVAGCPRRLDRKADPAGGCASRRADPPRHDPGTLGTTSGGVRSKLAEARNSTVNSPAQRSFRRPGRRSSASSGRSRS